MIDTFFRSSASPTFSTNFVCAEKYKTLVASKSIRKRVRFARNDQVHHVPSILSMVKSEKELGNVYMICSDWQRNRKDLKQALARHCPTVEKHQPNFRGRRKSLIQMAEYVVFQEQCNFRKQLLDLDCSRSDYEEQMAANYRAVGEKARFEAHHIALQLEAELERLKTMDNKS